MNKVQLALGAIATAATLNLGMIAPASADSAASTRNILLGVAAIAGIAIESNVARKNGQAHAVTGYLPDGSAVYGDGHVQTTNGYTYYPGNNGQSVACNNGQCSIAYTNGSSNGYNGNRYNGNAYNANGYNGAAYNANGYNANGYNGGWNNNSVYPNGHRRDDRDGR